jgi:hypothetical protein
MSLPIDDGRALCTTATPCTVITQADRSGSEQGGVLLARDCCNNNAQGEEAEV